jgi:hypothetical protein
VRQFRDFHVARFTSPLRRCAFKERTDKPLADLQEGKGFDHVVGLSKPLHEGGDELHGDLRVFVKQVKKHVFIQNGQLRVRISHDGGRPPLAVEQAQLAEEGALLELRQHHLGALIVCQDGFQFSRIHDIEVRAGVRFVKDHVGFLEADGPAPRGDLLELRVLEVTEDRNVL